MESLNLILVPGSQKGILGDREGFLRRSVQYVILVTLLGLGAGIVYATGGTGYAYPYVILLPVILAAAWFGVVASIASAIFAGLLLGPHMPLDVSRELMQSTHNWLVRIGFFVLIGAFTSWLFYNLRAATYRHLRDLRVDNETEMPNHAAVTEDIQKMISHGIREDVFSGQVAVVLIRMVDLWEILETMGIETSKHVVKNVADRISGSLDIDHTIYRFSTFEMMLLFSAESQGQVDSVAEKALRIGENESEVNGIPLRVQLAAGSYLVEDVFSTPERVINRARTGLSAAIDSDRFYRAYNPVLDQRITERVHLISRVRDGLRNREFELFYQPKVSLKTGQHVGGEGLLRWITSDGSTVLPGLFMPKLERTTLIDPVTRFVICKASEDIQRYGLLPVSINFSVKNLMDEGLIRNLGRIVSIYGIDPALLEIEITEGALIKDPAQARGAIQSLRKQGFMVSLDDFGTGYSSFQYLSQLPISGLKIDRAFVINLEHSADARTILNSMVKMAHALRLEVTVEGVETAKQFDIVSGTGADLVQGFHVARPLPIAAYTTWEYQREPGQKVQDSQQT